ncbi:hypothetical protein Fmac_003833 [Flemingia macrophylla]|uniref:Uncharacterized protein n=1 Tax=Flemingia macrophylla TaxID=520843 RepID=A0ABD1N3E1_9FABA
MGSSYFGEPNLGNERPSTSSRKGKKSNHSDKPKQPQRGLGVAQLEKIRLHGQMACAYHPSLHPYNINNVTQEDPRVQIAHSSVPLSSFSYSSSSTSSYAAASYGFQHNIMVGISDYQKTNIRYGDSQQTNIARYLILPAIYSAPSNITRPFLNLNDSQDIDTKKHRNVSVGSSNHNCESSDTQELDLELRLSL